MKKDTLSIGLLQQGGKEWIAGVIYNHNLIRALHLLPEQERPRLHMFVPLGANLEDDQELQGDLPRVHFYDYDHQFSLKHKLYVYRKSIFHKKIPMSLNRLAAKTSVDVLFPLHESLPKNFPVPWMGWIPDFQHKHFPEYFSKEELKMRDEIFSQLIKDAPRVVVSSQDAYQDLMKWFPTKEDKISVFPFTCVPVDEWYEENPEKYIVQYHLPDKFLILPSQFWIHKNHKVLLEAIHLLKERGINDVALVCTGCKEDYRNPKHFEELKTYMTRKEIEENVHILGLLPRQEQIQLMRMAVAVVQPSLFEGWSSLVEDSRALGKKIYLSDIPIHREQNPEQATYFDPHNAKELADAIANDWNRMNPGPDLKGEKDAYEKIIKRAKQFARSFIQIVVGGTPGASTSRSP